MILAQYSNGGTYVVLLKSGQKRRYTTGEEPPVKPETFDLKVTDFCDAGCPMCHEKSTRNGKHADLDALLSAIEPLGSGVEIAIGGGNPFDWPHLDEFLLEQKRRGRICNVTVNSKHVERNRARIINAQKKELLYGVGVSAKIYKPISWDALGLTKDHGIQNLCGHFIAYLNDLRLEDDGPKHALVLGYKDWGRGAQFGKWVPRKNKLDLQAQLMSLRAQGIKLSFDNLALDQLGVRDIVDDREWNSHFMGDDGKFSMYIDAVKQEFAKSSTSEARVTFSSTDVLSFFRSMQ